MVRVGLIGFGMAGQVFHAPTLRAVPGMELACILERSGSQAQEKYPEVRVARTLEELLTDQSIGLCVVATPPASHFDLTQRCLLAGRDVVVDKPFTVTSHEAEQLIALAEEKKTAAHRVSESALGRGFSNRAEHIAIRSTGPRG